MNERVAVHSIEDLKSTLEKALYMMNEIGNNIPYSTRDNAKGRFEGLGKEFENMTKQEERVWEWVYNLDNFSQAHSIAYDYVHAALVTASSMLDAEAEVTRAKNKPNQTS